MTQLDAEAEVARLRQALELIASTWCALAREIGEKSERLYKLGEHQRVVALDARSAAVETCARELRQTLREAQP